MTRFKMLREARKLNMRQTASILGMPYTTYVNYEKGMREPNSETLIQFADFYNVSIDYLLGRDLTPGCLSSPLIPALKETRSASELTQLEEEIIQKFRRLDERGQSAVLNVLDHEYSSLPGEKANSSAKQA